MLAATAGSQPGRNEVKANLFLELLSHPTTRQLSQHLDPTEQRIVEALAPDWYASKQITVLEVMNASKEISPSTVHRRLKTLRAKGMITLVNDEVDSRIKYVKPAPLLLALFDRIGVTMERIATGASRAGR